MKRVRSQRAGDLYDLHYKAICFSVVNNFYKFGHYCKIVRHPFLNTKQKTLPKRLKSSSMDPPQKRQKLCSPEAEPSMTDLSILPYSPMKAFYSDDDEYDDSSSDDDDAPTQLQLPLISFKSDNEWSDTDCDDPPINDDSPVMFSMKTLSFGEHPVVVLQLQHLKRLETLFICWNRFLYCKNVKFASYIVCKYLSIVDGSRHARRLMIQAASKPPPVLHPSRARSCSKSPWSGKFQHVCPLQLHEYQQVQTTTSEEEEEEEGDDDEMRNLCIVCGVDMGDSNPRQLCYKWHCPYE